MPQIIPVVLCGGAGSRLWPLSRTGLPKQFLRLTGTESLFQQAVRRLQDLGVANIKLAEPLIVTGEEYRFLALEQLHEIKTRPGAVLLEPISRNTAPALTLVALAAIENGDDPILVVTPADQTVIDSKAFSEAIEAAIQEAAKDAIIIFGVTPNSPDTGYGYIQVDKLSLAGDVKTVKGFIEKPDEITARSYLQEGGYYWNAGIFVLKASVWLGALQKFRSDIYDAASAAWIKRNVDGCFIRPAKKEFKAVPAESVDFAVIEHCPASDIPIKMVSLSAGWCDLGAWDSVWNVLLKDNQGNAHSGDVISYDTHNSLVFASSRLVSLVGVKNLAVIESPDVVLVVDRSRSQDVKSVVNTLQQQGRGEPNFHRKVHRPWGSYDLLDEGERFKVKRIMVKPNASLSLQKHEYRAEHWVVVKGVAEVICGGKKFLLSENQSTFIPQGEVHRLTNAGNTTLEIIEVQTGKYLSEDDIIRLSDDYDRITK